MRKFLMPLALLATGCVAPPQAPQPAAPPAPPVTEPYQAWDVTESRLELRVFRDGPMQQFAHDHLITSVGLRGVIQLREPRNRSGLALELPLDSLAVDDEAARAAAGGEFARPVPAKDRDATRRNLLGGAVLDAVRQPVATIALEGLDGGPRDYRARLRIGLRGEQRIVTLPLTVTEDDGRLRIHAQARLRHADFGLTPFTAALGAIRVRDDFELDCRLEARRRT